VNNGNPEIRESGLDQAVLNLRELGWHQMKVYDFGNKDVPEDKKQSKSRRGEKMLSGLATPYQVGPPPLPRGMANLDHQEDQN
jgi:hypothetical protein